MKFTPEQEAALSNIVQVARNNLAVQKADFAILAKRDFESLMAAEERRNGGDPIAAMNAVGSAHPEAYEEYRRKVLG